MASKDPLKDDEFRLYQDLLYTSSNMSLLKSDSTCVVERFDDFYTFPRNWMTVYLSLISVPVIYMGPPTVDGLHLSREW